jgi:hypothetical protein
MSARSERRRVRRALSANVDEYLTNNEDGAAMLEHCSTWLATQPGFGGASPSLCKAVLVNILGRELAQFGYFVDDAGVEGIRLVDAHGRPLSLATLYAAKLRMNLRRAFHHG